MATWCIEVSKSLKDQGHNVVMVVAPGLENMVPAGVDHFSINAFENVNRPFLKKVHDKLISWFGFLWPFPAPSLAGKAILEEAHRLQHTTEIVLWNQTNLLVPGHRLPQWVVGWAYPAALSGYLHKLKTKSDLPVLSRLRDLLYWYRTDNFAYQRASGVLSVTKALDVELQKKKINVIYAAPGCSTEYIRLPAPQNSQPHLVIVARWLDEARKNIPWLIEALAKISTANYRLSLIGDANETFKTEVRDKIPHGIFLGILPRNELMRELQKADMLLFGSALDDWGFVQVEAMANGLAVFAPAQLPSTEIIPDPRFLFKPGDAIDFKNKIEYLLENPDEIQKAKTIFHETYLQNFSSAVFARQLLLTTKNSMGT